MEYIYDEVSANVLFNLIKPQGVLFTSLISAQISDPEYLFEIPEMRLPGPSRKLIKEDKMQKLQRQSPFYSGRIHRDIQNRPYLRLGMADYFLFHLTSLILSIPQNSRDVIRKSSVGRLRQMFLGSLGGISNIINGTNNPISDFANANDHFNINGNNNGNSNPMWTCLQGLKDGQMRWESDFTHSFYNRIILSYLYYYFPIQRVGFESAHNTRLFNGASVIAIQQSQFFIGLVCELWFNQHEYQCVSDYEDGEESLVQMEREREREKEREREHEKEMEKVSEKIGKRKKEKILSIHPNFVIPTVDLLQISALITRHISTMIIMPENLVATPPILADYAFVRIRNMLYRFLRITFYLWPMDESFAYLVSLWYSFSIPWPQGNIEESKEWIYYIQNNLLYYTVLVHSVMKHILLILERAVKNGHFNLKSSMMAYCTMIQSLLLFKNDIKKTEELYLYHHNEDIANQVANLEHQSLPYEPLFTDSVLIQNILFYMEKLGLEGERNLTLKFFGPIVVSPMDISGSNSTSSLDESIIGNGRHSDNTHNLLRNRRIPIVPSLDLLNLKRSIVESSCLNSPLAHSYYSSSLEIPILVPILEKLSDIVNWIFQRILDIFGIEWIWLREYVFNMRFMANKRNLVYTLAIYLIYRLIKIII